MKPNTKEQLIHFMSTRISLGTYDRRFIDNLYTSNKQVTTNQAKLLDKIIIGYHKQFLKNDLNSVELVELPWKTKPIESLPQYTQAWLSIENSTIIIKTPYNVDYIKEIRKLPFEIKWNNEDGDKHWSVVFAPIVFKKIMTLTEKHYPNIINYCDNCKAIIDYLVSFEDCKYWNPTLVYKNNRPMIYAVNETLYEQLSDKLSDVTIATVIDLLQYGIEIDDTVKEQLKTQLNQVDDIDNTLDFILSYNPTMDISDTDKLVRYINMIGCEYVIIGPSLSRKNPDRDKIKNALQNTNIVCFDAVRNHRSIDAALVESSGKKSVYLDFDFSLLKPSPKTSLIKVIKLVNNRPIQL